MTDDATSLLRALRYFAFSSKSTDGPHNATYRAVQSGRYALRRRAGGLSPNRYTNALTELLAGGSAYLEVDADGETRIFVREPDGGWVR